MEALSSSSNRTSTCLNVLQTGGASYSCFRLMLVHDGFQHIDRVVDDLRSRAFPDDTELLIVSVSDLFRTSFHSASNDDVPSVQVRPHSRAGLPKHKKSQAFFDKLEFSARQARARLQSAFPRWDIQLERPLSWQPDLIYLSSFDPSAISDIALGEIIRKISAESNIPLIVARPPSDPLKRRRFSVAVFDGPGSATLLVEELQRREVEAGSELYLIFYKDLLMSAAERWTAGYDERAAEWPDRQLFETRSAVEALGYRVSCMNVVGNTAQAILREARRVEAQRILLSLTGSRSAGMQSIAATVAAQAGCTVEIFFAEQESERITGIRSAPKNMARWAGGNESRARAALSSQM